MKVGPFRIDVVVVEPGAIRTEWSKIARQGLVEASGAGPYAEQARLSGALLAGAGQGSGASPEVVPRAVSSALAARRPRTPYVVGDGATPVIGLRWLLGDRAFDAVMRAARSIAAP